MHFPALVIGSDPQQIIAKYGVFQNEAEGEHDDGRFDYAEPGGMFKSGLVLSEAVQRPKIFGIFPAGATNRGFTCTLDKLDLEATLDQIHLSAVVTPREWVELPEEVGAMKDAVRKVIGALHASATITIFDCHA